MRLKHGDRVAVQLAKHGKQDKNGTVAGNDHGESDCCGSARSANSSSEACLPSFTFVRDGLTIDEYHTHGSDTSYEEELNKRVEAALSLSQPEDSCEKQTSARREA